MVKGYSSVQIILHWVVGVLIVYQLLRGDDMKPMWDELQRNGSYTMTLGGLLHILVGIIILVLVLWRMGLRLSRGAPDLPDSTPAMETAAKAGHWVIYALMLAMPITGLSGFFLGVDVLADLHGGLLKALLWVVILGHVALGLYHQFVLKDGLLDRMRTPR